MPEDRHDGWSIDDSAALYNLPGWGDGHFALNARGHLVVHPRGPGEGAIDLPELVGELAERGLELPLGAALRLGADHFGLAACDGDFREGTAAFLAKRPPRWTQTPATFDPEPPHEEDNPS